MAPSAISPPSSPQLLPAPVKDVDSILKHKDFRADLQRDGYAVIKGAIPRERAIDYQKRAYQWLKSFDNDALDFDDPSTWKKENLPVQSKINTFSSYGIAHEKFVWDVRMEPGVLSPFEKLWGTDELLVSFDSLNVTFPNRPGVPRKPAWEHIDQSPLRRGLHCVQGVVCLSPSGPEDGGLMVYPGSHALNDHFFDTQTDPKDWKRRDLYMMTPEELKWFAARDIAPHKVCADVGDLILWDSRTVHYGAEPTPRSFQIRTAIYTAYTPASWASEEQLELKREAFEGFGGTTHWPHDNIVIRENKTFLEDGTRDPRDRDQPSEMPEMSEKLLKLAGAMRY